MKTKAVAQGSLGAIAYSNHGNQHPETEKQPAQKETVLTNASKTKIERPLPLSAAFSSTPLTLFDPKEINLFHINTH